MDILRKFKLNRQEQRWRTLILSQTSQFQRIRRLNTLTPNSKEDISLYNEIQDHAKKRKILSAELRRDRSIYNEHQNSKGRSDEIAYNKVEDLMDDEYQKYHHFAERNKGLLFGDGNT